VTADAHAPNKAWGAPKATRASTRRGGERRGERKQQQQHEHLAAIE